MADIIQTRQELDIVLIVRNDGTTNWEKSSYKLEIGEIGMEYLANGKVKLKAGAKDTEGNLKAWKDLPYIGADEAQVYQTEVLPADNTQTDLEAIAAVVNGAELHNGDSAIVKRAAGTTDKVFYTSYVYNGTTWAAMDGNYDATNVYFSNDITLAGSYTQVGNVTKSSNAATGELKAAGKSLADVMQSIFTKELYPATGSSINKPTITLSGDADASGEVGSSYTLPTVTLTVSDVGAYTYGPATGIKFEAGKLTLAQGAVASATNKTTNSSDFVANSTMSLTATDSATLYTDSAKSYEFNASGSYTQGAAPKTNLGNELDTDDSTEEAINAWTYRIPAGSTSATKRTIKRSGYRNMFCGGTTEATVNSAVVRGFTAKKNSKPTTEAAALEFEAAGGSTKVICAFPNGWTGTPYFEMFGLAWAENSNFKAKSNVDVADARGTNEDGTLNGAISYKIYAWELETPLEAETTKFRVYFK